MGLRDDIEKARLAALPKVQQDSIAERLAASKAKSVSAIFAERMAEFERSRWDAVALLKESGIPTIRCAVGGGAKGGFREDGWVIAGGDVSNYLSAYGWFLGINNFFGEGEVERVNQAKRWGRVEEATVVSVQLGDYGLRNIRTDDGEPYVVTHSYETEYRHTLLPWFAEKVGGFLASGGRPQSMH